MIDGFRSTITAAPEVILSNPNLEFTHSNISTKTGEMLPGRSQSTFYNGLTITVTSKGNYLKGSLHQYHEGGTNYKDFSYGNIRSTVDGISEELNINPDLSYLTFFEIGLNLNVERDPNDYIDGAITYKSTPFEKIYKQRGTKGHGRQATKDRFAVKVYDKGLQFNRPDNLLRFELKVTRMAHLKRYGLPRLTLSDLKNKEYYSVFLTMLLDALHGILFFDNRTNVDQLKGKTRDLVLQGQFGDYWTRSMPFSTRKDRRRKFAQLGGSDAMKQYLEKLIIAKWDYLMSVPEIEKTGRIHNIVYGENRRYCPITGLEMINQRGKHFITQAGIKYYFEHAPAEYEARLYTLLSEKWIKSHPNATSQETFKEISHMIRNSYYNPANNTRKCYNMLESKNPKLFDTVPLLADDKRRYLLPTISIAI